MKKILRVLLWLVMLCMLMGTLAGTTAYGAAGFSDVSEGAYYAGAVEWAVKNGVTTGTSNTSFSPSVTCTRGQVVTFLWRAAGSPKASGSNPFRDVKSSQYYYKAVLWAVKKGITSGTSKTTFSPGASCTRGQVVTFFWRAAGGPTVKASNPFRDVKKSQYYYKAVLWAVREGITAGTSKTAFSPDTSCTRAQIVTFLCRFYSPFLGQGSIRAYNKSSDSATRTLGSTADLSKRGSKEYYAFSFLLTNTTSGSLTAKTSYITIDGVRKVGWASFTLKAGQSVLLHVDQANMQSYLQMGSYDVRLFINDKQVGFETLVFSDSSYADKSTYWKDVFPLPTSSQIKAYKNPNNCRSQYIHGWAAIGNEVLFDEYSIDFKSDHFPLGTYCSVANWQIDCSALLKKYASVSHADGGVHGYTGLQNTEKGKKFIMSIWEVYATAHNGKVTTIRPKVVYPTNAQMGSFDNEGSGGQFFATYNWEPSHWYRLYMACTTDQKTGNTIITTRLCDLETEVWTKMCAYDVGFKTSFKGSMGVFLENYIYQQAGQIRSMELRNMRIRSAGQWQNIDTMVLSASDTMVSPDFTLYLDGSYAFGARGDRFYMITSGVGGDWYHNGTGQKAAYFTATHTETGSPIK